MKKILILTFTGITCAVSSQCEHLTNRQVAPPYIPAKDNHSVMMRPGDMQFQDEVDSTKKYAKDPTHEFNLARFFRELFSPRSKVQSAPNPTPLSK